MVVTGDVGDYYKMLELKNIRKSFGDVQVLNGANLRLERGLIYTLKGGNGSGKSTILKTIYGLLKPWTQKRRIYNLLNDTTKMFEYRLGGLYCLWA